MRHEQIYQAIKEEHETYGYSISALCRLGNVSRAAYYKWLHRESPTNELENERIAQTIEKIHTESLIRFLLADTQLFALCMFKPNITPGRLFIFQGSGGSIFNSLTYTKDERPFYRFQNEIFLIFY